MVGAPPVMTFAMADGSGMPITSTRAVARLAATAAGPTSDYSLVVQNGVLGGGSVGRLENLGGGSFRYTFRDVIHVIPPAASGTWGFGLEGYRSGSLPDGTTYRYGAKNPVAYLNLAGGTATPRRTAVDVDNCNACHGELSLHGNNRVGQTQYCVMCHNPTATDAAVRPAGHGSPVTIDFKVMIHKIHRGGALPSFVESGTPYVIYGFGGSANTFTSGGFPGSLNDCAKCHTPGSFTEPSTAVCTSCHDGQATVGHAQLNTTAGGIETCSVCHGSDAEFAVEKVHAQ
jgi:OmcA/MtrC family decaheme c-type cytochrome